MALQILYITSLLTNPCIVHESHRLLKIIEKSLVKVSIIEHEENKVETDIQG